MLSHQTDALRPTQVRIVGTLSVIRADELIAGSAIGSRKARTLLALLAVNRRRHVQADRAIDVLWGGMPPVKALEAVATLVSRLRGVLGPDVIVGRRPAYRLGDSIRVDLEDAAWLVNRAESHAVLRTTPAAALSSARRALNILDPSDVLADEPTALWVDPARSTHRDLLRRARIGVARAALKTGDFRLAQVVTDAALEADCLDEAACRLRMMAFHATAEPAKALATYERLRAALADDLGVDPAQATRDVHLSVLRDFQPADKHHPDEWPIRTLRV
ncbi:AfsR/SARP family transcriptional regulator [Kribbella sp. CA-253562]|uniref:AfsR/SARP family transcriptional regulator n=1 Tax=Kribbella sp. CA-253562 TaxID=3239942 RepID=UPI003D909686